MVRRKIKEALSLLFVYKKYFLVILIGIVIAWLGYFLRLQQFSSFPPVNDTRDEYKYAFNGISLIKRGVPESWSWYDDYGKFEIKNIRGSEYRLVKPYFEDPPLFGLIMGEYAISKGMDSYDKVDSGALRWPILKLGALNIFLLFILVYLVGGIFEAIIAGLIYATVPTIVLSSRLPLAENLLVTIALFSLILLLFYLKRKSFIVLIFIALISGVSVLLKQTGVYIPAAIFFLFLSQKKYKPAIIVALCSLFFLGIWYAYGYYYNWELFLRLQGLYLGREIRLPTMIINLFDTFRISEKMMSTDGIIIWGWISIAIYSLLIKAEKAEKKLPNLLLPIMTGFYLLVFSVMSGHIKGWYRIPLYPFLSWAIAGVVIEMIKNPNFIYTFFFITIPAAASWVGGMGGSFFTSIQVKIYQLIIPTLIAPSLLFQIKFSEKLFKRLAQIIIVLVLIFIIWMNVRTILFYQDQFWY